MKFLVDECLSPELTKLAHAKGHGESPHVVWLGRAGLKDWELKPIILGGDWTFITKNSVDFRGPAERPGTKGQYAEVALHAGLICLNGPLSRTIVGRSISTNWRARPEAPSHGVPIQRHRPEPRTV